MDTHHTDLVVSVCEEFSDWVLYDSIHKSVIVNIKQEFFVVLKRELYKIGFKNVHSCTLPETDTITCVFLKK